MPLRKPLIVDTFLFLDEWDLLACRLDELSPVVDRFVAAVGDRTFTGAPIFGDLPVMSKLTVVRAHLPHHSPPLEREWFSRDALGDVLTDLEPDDLVMHSDLDEIPQREHVAELTGACRFAHVQHYWYVDLRCPDDPPPGTVVLPYGEIESVSRQRQRRLDDSLPLVQSGHHFTWLGPHERRMRKLHAFSHPELVKSWGSCMEQCVRDGVYPPPDSRKLEAVEIDETYPHWIREGHAPACWFRERGA